jgi:hypothetical protein
LGKLGFTSDFFVSGREEAAGGTGREAVSGTVVTGEEEMGVPLTAVVAAVSTVGVGEGFKRVETVLSVGVTVGETMGSLVGTEVTGTGVDVSVRVGEPMIWVTSVSTGVGEKVKTT